MKFDERFIEELKSRLRPSDVIGRTVKLKRQGREFAGLSPFTKEKSPSFFVNDEKGFFHDFSSGKHGDIISFLQETERLSFVEAVERLANEAGMALPAPDPQAAAREPRRRSLFGWTELAMKWFSANLRRSVGAGTREYLKKRGLPEEQWERFGLGYAPNDREGLKAALIQQGATPGDLVEAGLLLAPEGGPQAAGHLETGRPGGGRGLYGCHRLSEGGHSGGRAHGHGPDRGADGAAVAGPARAHPVL